MAVVVGENNLEHLLHGVFHHLLARMVAVGRSGAGIEQSHIVVDLGGGAYGGAGVLVGGLLLDADYRTQSGDLVHVGALHATKEIARIGRESLDVAALPLGVDGVEGKRRLPRARQSGDDGQASTGYLHVDVFQIVHSGTVDIDFLVFALHVSRFLFVLPGQP